MTRTITVLIGLFVCAGPTARALAQSSAAPAGLEAGPYELVLADGSHLFGTIESQDESHVVFATRSGARVMASRADIISLRRITGTLVNGELQTPDPNATRLFFGPTGRALARGHTYLGVYEFVMPFVQVGITDRVSIGGGTPLIFGIEDWNRPFWITPKVQIRDGERTQVAVGLFHAFDTDSDSGGVGYVVGTHGGARASFTLGGGVAYGSNGGRSGVVMLGGERQVRRNMKIVTESYLWKDGNGVASGGVRFFGERLSADLAFGIPIGADGLYLFPVVNFVYLF